VKISFIITTLGREEELTACIASIERACEYAQNPDIEILVVFQGVQDDKDAGGRQKQAVFYYIQEKGLSAARNFAIKKSTGDYLVFLDDDAGIKEDFLSVLMKSILLLNAGAFCGKIVDPVNNQFYASCFLDNKCRPLGYFDFVYFMGSAHVLKKTTIEKIGFYDQKFGAGAQYPAAEESDMFFRLKQWQEEIIYQPELIFFHRINYVTSDIKRFNYAYAVAAMLTKQIVLDGKHRLIYLFIISEVILKSFLRTLQTIFFMKSIELKNSRFRYKSVFKGSFKGVFDYIKECGRK